MTTNELEGRALHEAAARAMGFTIAHGSVYGGEKWRGDVKVERCPDCGAYSSGLPIEREMLAHLTKRGIVKAAMSAIACDVEFIPRLGTQSFDYMDTYPKAHGRDLREALARLVVAVAARDAKQA